MSQYFDEKELFLEPKTHQVGSHMIMSNVQKPTKTKIINVDTKFRDDYQYNQVCNFTITLPERINEVRSIEVKSTEIPLSFYNISANLGNNYFKVASYSTPTSYTVIDVSDGYYTSSTIAAAVNGAIQNASSNFRNLIYVVSDGFSGFRTTDSEYSYIVEFDIDSTGSADKFNFNTKLGWLMGFRDIKYNVTSITNYVYSEKLVDLSSPRYLYLALEEFNKGNQKSFVTPLAGYMVNKNVIARIQLNNQLYPNGLGSGSITVLPSNEFNGLLSDVRMYTGKVDLQRINVQLLSETGIPMDLNGLDFSFCLEVVHEA
jgi:hypothetical protein